MSFRSCRAVLAVGALCAALGLEACTAHAPGRTPEAALVAANAAQQRGDLATAEAGYHEVLAADPANHIALYDLGLIAQRRGDLELAKRDYLAAVAVAPSYEPALYNLATVLGALGPDTAAVDYYRRAIAVAPHDAAAHRNLGLLLIKDGDRTAGQAELAEAHALDPTLSAVAPTAAGPVTKAGRPTG